MIRLSFGCLGALLLLFLVSPSHAATITHLSYGAHGSAWHDYLGVMKEAFEQAYPGHRVEILIEPDPVEKFAVMLGAGVSPDILDFSTGQAAPFIPDGNFLDLRPWIERDSDVSLSDFPTPVIEGLTAPDGSLIGLPVSVYPITTWYNLDFLNEAGLASPAELGSDWTWDVLAEYGRKLTQDRDGDGQNEVWGIDRIRSRPYIQVVQAGGFYFDREMLPTQSRLLSEPVLSALEYLRGIVVVDKTSQGLDVPNVAQTYMWHGRSAINVVDGPGAIPFYEGAPFEWDVWLQPTGPDNNATAVFVTSFQISSHTQAPDVAWEWVKFITAREEAQQTFARITGRIPILSSVTRDLDQFVSPLPSNWHIFLEQTLHPKNVGGYGVVPDTRVTQTLNSYLNAIWRDEMPVRTAMQRAHDEISAFFAERR